MDPRAILDGVERLYRDSIYDPSIVESVMFRYTNAAIPEE
jgi:hypothetical protein